MTLSRAELVVLFLVVVNVYAVVLMWVVDPCPGVSISLQSC